jgi:hypothetical protein
LYRLGMLNWFLVKLVERESVRVQIRSGSELACGGRNTWKLHGDLGLPPQITPKWLNI